MPASDFRRYSRVAQHKNICYNMSMKKVLLFIPNGAEILEAAAFIDIFGWDSICGSRSCQLTIAASKSPIQAGFGPALCSNILLNEAKAKDYDALAIPGGFPRHGYFRDLEEQALSLIRSFHELEKPIAAVCTASLLLAKAGILADRRATTYISEDTYFFSQLTAAGALLINEPLVQDGHIITSQGPSTAIDAALLLLGFLTDENNADYVRKIMGFSIATIGANSNQKS